ncbi:MAG: T9SS type A sorting domain-containing protein, partial [Phaeodactylibacter sp.]|nr:T9SS type A sorting domain-containing protein [Phaeodactylibacter sp.]
KCVNPGILGDNPEIPEQPEPQAGVPMQYDFRDVYGSIMMDWFEVAENDVRSLLYQEFQYLPVLQPCATTKTQETAAFGQEIEASFFPNPFREWATIRFMSNGEWVKLSIYNSLGSEIRVLINRHLPAGEHEARFDAHGLPPGNYYFRIQLDGRQKTKGVVKA